MKRRRDESYSTLEVARLLGVTVQTVQRWVDAGHLQAWRTVGGHRRIDAGSVQRFREASGASPLPAANDAAAAPTDPVHAGPADAPSADPAAAPSGEPGRPVEVLVVDDDPAEREAIAYLLGRLRPSWRVEFADNGIAALLAIGRRSPQVLITDVMMPHLNGPAMLRTLFEAPEYRDMAILAMSSHSADEVQAMGGLPQGVAFLNKPVSRAALAHFIEHSQVGASAS